MTGDEEVERRLTAYADARLHPDASTTQRTRAAVMAHAERVLGGTSVAGSNAPAARPERPMPFIQRHRRAPIFALLAAALLVALMVGAAAALTGPGQPLYQARLWFESTTLPTDPAAREAAQLSRLQARLDEVHAALQAADPGAAGEALAAYAATLDAIAADQAVDTAVRDHVQAALTNHITVLTGLLDQVPPAVRAGIENAITRSGEALQRVAGDNGSNGNASPGPGQDKGGNGNASPGPGQDKGGNGNASPGPGQDQTSSPEPSPSPTHDQVHPSPGPPSPKP
jgi:hypothetical protein